MQRMSWILSILLALSAGFADASPPPQSRIAIVGGRVVTMAGTIHSPGTVLIDDDRIVAVGGVELAVPGRYRRVQAAGAWVIPGLIDAGTRLGLVEVDLEDATTHQDDHTDLFSPHLRVTDAINPDSELIPVGRLTGVTTVLVSPTENNLFSGEAAVIDLLGEDVVDMTIRSPAMLCLNLGLDPIFRGRSRSKFATRMGLIAEIRQLFHQAEAFDRKYVKHQKELLEYEERIEKASEEESAREDEGQEESSESDDGEGEASEGDSRKGDLKDKDEKDPGEEEPEPPEELDRDLKMEALRRALAGEIKVLVRAHRQDDIRAAIRLADEFDLDIVINHGTEAWRVASLLAEKNIPVIVGPINTQPDTWETLGARYDNAELLKRAGVDIAIQSSEAHNVRNLPYMAGLAAAHGLPPDEALEAITIGAARILGIEDDYGSLEPGKVANIAITEGDPLQPRSRLRALYIRGQEVPLVSKQTELYEKFKDRTAESR